MERQRGQGAVLTAAIRTVAATGSTNADLLELARSGAVEGLWLVAERQTAGRGRQGRTWESPPGNLYASTLVRLRRDDPSAPGLALVAAVALHEVVAAVLTGGRRGGLLLKWPNDLLLDGAKLAGILLERADDAVVIGVGVNAQHHPALPDRPTTSLAASGVLTTPAELVAALAAAMAAGLRRWRGEGIATVAADWMGRAHPVGTPLAVRLPDGEAIDGRFDGLDAAGALRLRLADGSARVIHAADVFLVQEGR